MKFKIYISIFIIGALLTMWGCNKEEFKMGSIKTPSNLGIATTITGATTTLPAGDGTGLVSITLSGNDVLTYKVDFGDGTNKELSPSGIITHKYAKVGTFDYYITVNAYGTGGTSSTISKKITVNYKYELAAEIMTALTNNASKIWITDKGANGHFGVGPSSTFGPDWYAAGPNTREACAYDDEITFSKTGTNAATINVDNKGQSFYIGAASAFYGFSGGDACNTFSTGGSKALAFSEASSGSSSANSTKVQFYVPGNGIINFGTGANTYEIISLTATNMMLRNIGADGNAWYQKLIAK